MVSNLMVALGNDPEFRNNTNFKEKEDILFPSKQYMWYESTRLYYQTCLRVLAKVQVLLNQCIYGTIFTSYSDFCPFTVKLQDFNKGIGIGFWYWGLGLCFGMDLELGLKIGIKDWDLGFGLLLYFYCLLGPAFLFQGTFVILMDIFGLCRS